MSLVLAIDPGVRFCGAALFTLKGGRLLHAELVESTYVRPPTHRIAGVASGAALAKAVDQWLRCASGDEDVPGAPPLLDTLVIEVPQVYAGAKNEVPTDDLVDLTLHAGAIAGRIRAAACVTVRPFDWKGHETKKITGGRVDDRLTDEEKARIVKAGAKTHNVIDAVGIGLHFLGRYHEKRICR